MHINLTGLFSWIRDAATAKLILRDTAWCFYLISAGLLIHSFQKDTFMDDLPMNALFFILAKLLRWYESTFAALILLLISQLTFGSKLYLLIKTGTLYTHNPEHGGLIIISTATAYICLRSIEASIRLKLFAAKANKRFKT